MTPSNKMASHKPSDGESIEQRPPLQPVPPSMDLGFVSPPVDPLGMSMQPTGTEQPVRNDDKHSVLHTWLVVFALVLSAIAAIALGVWLAP